MAILDERLLQSARRGTARAGKSDLIAYLTGKTLTRQKAIRAKCYDCNGMGEQKTCDIVSCSLYPYSPTRLKR
jgi:hypothetical protein